MGIPGYSSRFHPDLLQVEPEITPSTPAARESVSDGRIEITAGIDTPYIVEEPNSLMESHDPNYTSQTSPLQTHPLSTRAATTQTNPLQTRPTQRVAPEGMQWQSVQPQTLPLPPRGVPGQPHVGSFSERQRSATRQPYAEFQPFQQPASFPANQPHAGFFHAVQPSAGFSPRNQQQYAHTFPTGQSTAGTFPSGQEPAGHPNTGSFSGPQPSGFFIGNQPTVDQISAESITAAHISTGPSQPFGGSIRAQHISAAFITAGQESGHQLGAGSLTAGKLCVNSITTGPMPAGPITAGELHVGSIGPGQPSA